MNKKEKRKIEMKKQSEKKFKGKWLTIKWKENNTESRELEREQGNVEMKRMRISRNRE